MILSFVNIRKVPREMLKTDGFQHLPRDLANVNEWKIMFDPYIADYATAAVIFIMIFSIIIFEIALFVNVWKMQNIISLDANAFRPETSSF